MISVEDANDNIPMFVQTEYTMHVYENLAGVEIGHVSANDADSGINAKLNYLIMSGNWQGYKQF